jgi:hypothetical protein
MANPVRRFGWLPDLPDQRDFLYSAPAQYMRALPSQVNLRKGCPPVYNQSDLGSCHDDKTEVLTDHGFKLFSQLDGSERLATVNPETAELFFEVPVRLVRFPYTGEMHCVANRSLNFRVTPDHKMLVRKWDESKRTLSESYEFVAAKDIGWYAGLMNRVEWKGELQSDTYTLPGVAHKQKEQREPKDIPLKSWVRFLGLYLAEGTMLKRDQRQGKVSYKIQIAAAKEREKAIVRQTLAEIGVSALELADRFTFQNRRIYEAIASYGLEGVKAGRKFVPSFLFRLSAEMISEFLAGHFAGDGSEQYGVRAHYTSSAKLAADLQALIFMSGNETRMSVRQRRSSMTADGSQVIGTLPEHRISVCEQKNLSIERSRVWFTEEYDGEVFCAEVPTYHTLVTRREGKILISGNCTANAIGAALQFDELKQKEANPFQPSRLFIYYNERVMENTVNSDSGARIRDGIKSVAKTGYCPETEWLYDITKFAVRPPAICYQDAKKYKALSYQRVMQSLSQMKGCLAAGTPFVAGFSVYESIRNAEVEKTGNIPLPQQKEALLGGHAILIVGYDDTKQVFNLRNSWGDGWGDGGYGTLPYAYLSSPRLASDFWVINTVS